MSGSLKSELRHLLQIGLGIVELGIVHIEQCEWYPISSPSCLKNGCKYDDNFLIEVSSVEWLARWESINENNPFDVPKHCEYGFSELRSSWDCFFRPNLYWIWDCIQKDPTLILSDNVAEINVRLWLPDLEKHFCAINSFPPKLLRGHVWDPFEITTLKTKGLSHVLPDHNS
jgi:hypothetical protein